MLRSWRVGEAVGGPSEALAVDFGVVAQASEVVARGDRRHGCVPVEVVVIEHAQRFQQRHLGPAELSTPAVAALHKPRVPPRRARRATDAAEVVAPRMLRSPAHQIQRLPIRRPSPGARKAESAKMRVHEVELVLRRPSLVPPLAVEAARNSHHRVCRIGRDPSQRR